MNISQEKNIIKYKYQKEEPNIIFYGHVKYNKNNVIFIYKGIKFKNEDGEIIKSRFIEDFIVQFGYHPLWVDARLEKNGIKYKFSRMGRLINYSYFQE